jgi:hypothetical protein
MADQKQVLEKHRQHPDWNVNQIAASLDCTAGYVRATAQRLNLRLPYARPDSLTALGAAARDAGLTVAGIKALAAKARTPGAAAALVAVGLIAAIATISASIATRIAEVML